MKELKELEKSINTRLKISSDFAITACINRLEPAKEARRRFNVDVISIDLLRVSKNLVHLERIASDTEDGEEDQVDLLNNHIMETIESLIFLLTNQEARLRGLR